MYQNRLLTRTCTLIRALLLLPLSIIAVFVHSFITIKNILPNKQCKFTYNKLSLTHLFNVLLDLRYDIRLCADCARIEIYAHVRYNMYRNIF